jgi:hypothetical protein
MARGVVIVAPGFRDIVETRHNRRTTMAERYIVIKRSRNPDGWISYNGPTWDRAGIRARRQDAYSSAQVAQEIADLLSGFNPVGFVVMPVPAAAMSLANIGTTEPGSAAGMAERSATTEDEERTEESRHG